MPPTYYLIDMIFFVHTSNSIIGELSKYDLLLKHFNEKLWIIVISNFGWDAIIIFWYYCYFWLVKCLINVTSFKMYYVDINTIKAFQFSQGYILIYWQQWIWN